MLRLSEIPIVRPGQKVTLLIAFLSMGLYIQIGWFTERTHTDILLWSYTILFAFFYLLNNAIFSYRGLIAFGILFRLVFLFSLPNLSDDYYRFFWDGLLANHGINPFGILPEEIIENPGINIPAIDRELFVKLNSPEYFTVYPPVAQFVFQFSAWAGGGRLPEAVLIMKLFIFIAELGSMYLTATLLRGLGLNRGRIFLYALNPLVIIELTGNLHFEAFMIFFILLSVWLLQNNKVVPAGVAFAGAIASKLLPVLLLPFFLKRLGWEKAMVFYGFTLFFTVMSFWPFLSGELIEGLSSSIGLYFQKFEFNAGIFYIVRAIGFWIKGWDVIQVAGPWLGALSAFMIFLVFLMDKPHKGRLPGIFLWPLFIYLALSSIVHPWYITPLIAFGLFTNYRFPVAWSFFVFLSYAGYSPQGYTEQTWVLVAEYLVVFGVLIYELLRFRKNESSTTIPPRRAHF